MQAPSAHDESPSLALPMQIGISLIKPYQGEGNNFALRLPPRVNPGLPLSAPYGAYIIVAIPVEDGEEGWPHRGQTLVEKIAIKMPAPQRGATIYLTYNKNKVGWTAEKKHGFSAYSVAVIKGLLTNYQKNFANI